MWGSNYGGYPQGQQFGQQFGQIPQSQGQMMQGYGQMPAAPMRDDRIWVEGEEAARSFLVAANSSAVLWDSGSDTIYFKRTDVSGRPLPMMPHYNQGGHSYADGWNGSNGTYGQKRDSMGRYSKAAEDKNRIIKDIEKMTDKFTDAEWDVMEDFVRRIREAS